MNRQSLPAPQSHVEPYQHQQSDAYDISGASTDAQLIAMWLSGRPKNTVRAYRADIDRMRRHVDKPLHKITARDLIDWAETLARLKPASQYRRLSAVKSLFSYSLSLGYLRLDPAAALRMPRVPEDRASKLLSIEAVQSILAAVSGRDRLICVTLYLTGVRESELVGLNADDLHDSALTIRGKGDKIRTIAIPESLATALREISTSGPLFRSKNDKRLDASAVYRIVTKAARAAGVRCSPHQLRHAHASHSLDNGAPLHVVKDSLGHASLATTSIYSHCRPSDGASLYLNDVTCSPHPAADPEC